MALVTRGLPPLNAIRREEADQLPDGRRSGGDEGVGSRLEQAVHDVRGRHFLTIATSPRHVFAHARGPRSDRDPRSSRDLCAQVTPRRRTKEPLS